MQEHPFTPEQFIYNLKSLFTKESFICGVAGVLASVFNHVAGAPPFWKAAAVIAITALIADVVTGTLRSKIVKRKKGANPKDATCAACNSPCNFNSRALGATFVKSLVYFSLLLVSLGLDFGMSYALQGGNLVYWFSGLVLGAIAGREVLSNFENAKEIFTYIKEPWIFQEFEDAASGAIHMIQHKNKEDKPDKVE